MQSIGKGVFITNLFSTDRDLDYPDQSSQITYAISAELPQAQRLFEITNQTGGKFNLGLRTTISREMENSSCFLVPIIATLETMGRTATSTLTVIVSTDSPPAPGSGSGSLVVYVPSGEAFI